jgi:hypothetical protein
MPLPIDHDLDAVVHHRFAVEPFAEPGLAQQVHGALLQQPGPHSALDIITRSTLEHDRLNARPGQQMRKHEPRRPRAHNGDLRAHLAAVSA